MEYVELLKTAVDHLAEECCKLEFLPAELKSELSILTSLPVPILFMGARNGVAQLLAVEGSNLFELLFQTPSSEATQEEMINSIMKSKTFILNLKVFSSENKDFKEIAVRVRLLHKFFEDLYDKTSGLTNETDKKELTIIYKIFRYIIYICEIIKAT